MNYSALSHRPVVTNQQHRENLIKLAQYLESLPDNYEHFSMSSYLRVRDMSSNHYPAFVSCKPGDTQQCGTVACAVGHSLDAGIEFPIHITNWDMASDYLSYENMEVFDWLFSGSWASIDNTARGAARRIRYYLEHGCPVIGDGDRLDTLSQYLRELAELTNYNSEEINDKQ